MIFTPDERKLFTLLVQKELDTFKEEENTFVTQDNPGFLALEDKYEEFLEKLLKKL
ncbi:MAG: hypothetical protein ABIA62_01385 [Candidatus Woesearchaeota archaeon]